MGNMTIKETIHANGVEISLLSSPNTDDYISLTDIARYRSDEPSAVIQNWMRNRDTLEFLGLWEKLNNPDFKPLEFEGFARNAGRNAFTMSPKKWIDATGAIGILTKSGHGGGTYAHTDIAFEFASWVSPEFKLYIIKDYQRLKSDENHQLALEWNVHRLLAKANYKIHTDAIKENLIPEELSPRQMSYVYANEADLLNVALFGQTAAEWRKATGKKKGNMRDDATIEQLLVLANLESINAMLIEQDIPQSARLQQLRQIAVSQLSTLQANKSVERLNAIHQNTQQLQPPKG